MVVFEGTVGRVVALDDPAAQGVMHVASVPGDPIGFDTQRSIITRMTCAQHVNVQFLHTFGKHVYVYVFGDRMGEISLAGLSFATTCPDGDGIAPVGQPHGIVEMFDWYRRNKASKRASAIQVNIGMKDNLDGFVVGFGFDAIDPATQMCQWNLAIAALPED
jgi:hypothetical protein